MGRGWGLCFHARTSNESHVSHVVIIGGGVTVTAQSETNELFYVSLKTPREDIISAAVPLLDKHLKSLTCFFIGWLYGP